MRMMLGTALLVTIQAAGCGGGGESAATTTTASAERSTTTSTTTTSTTTVTETTTFAQADQPPALVNTGEDLDAVVRSFVAYGEWLSVHPDADRLAEIYRQNSPAWLQLIDAYRELESNNWHTDGSNPGSIGYFEEVSRAGPDVAQVLLHIMSPRFTVIDSSGAVVSTFDASPLTAWVYELRRSNQVWFVESRTVIGPVE